MNVTRSLSAFQLAVAAMLVLLLCGMLGLGGVVALSSTGFFAPQEESLQVVSPASLAARPTATTTSPPTSVHSSPSPTRTPTPIPPTNTLVPIPPTDIYTPVPPTATPGTPRPTRTPVPSVEDQMLILINEERQERGLSTLVRSGLLDSVARGHNEDMIKRDFVEHVNPDGLTPFDRMERAGYGSYFAAENIAAGPGLAAPKDTFLAWMGSPGHKKNIIAEDPTEIGISYVQGGSMTNYWTTLFARPSR